MKKNSLISLTVALALAAVNPVNAEISLDKGCRILKQESSICSSIQYLTNVESVAKAESRIQGYFGGIPSSLSSLQAPCIAALQDALCLLEFPKCVEGANKPAPVCWSVRDYVAKRCYEPFNYSHSSSSPVSSHHRDGNEDISLAQIRDSLFPSSLDFRWAKSADVQEPDCVSFQDHGLGTTPIDNIKIFNDLPEDVNADALDDYHRMIDQDVDADQSGLFEYSHEEADPTVVMDAVDVTLKSRHLSRRERSKHHHHHHNDQQKKQPSKEKRDLEHVAATSPASSAKIVADHLAPNVAIHADGESGESGQSVYTLNDQGDSAAAAPAPGVLIHESLSHSESSKPDSAIPEGAGGAEGTQKVLIQGGSGAASPETASESLEKANAGHPVDATAADAQDAKEGESHPKKGTVLLAAVPILLLMGAIAGFTVYRRYQENRLDQNRNDLHDDLSGDGYHRRDLPIRKGSPIHFDRTFLNTIHSPPPTATYLHDPESSSRHQSPSSITSATNMKRPPPSAGSLGKTRFQELNRSYDFGAGFRSIKNALTRSTNTSRDSALDQASNNASSGSINNGKNVVAFGAGGHSLAKIGSHPGLNALERQQLQQQYGASSSAGSSGSRFPDMNTLTIPTEGTIVWGQYSANDDDQYQDAATAAASNLARKSASTNSLSMLSGGKYSHHHQQSSGHQPDTPTDSIGDCLSPESPSVTREEMMRRRNLFAEGYAFGSEASVGDDANSGSDLLFDARDNFYDLGNEKAHDASLRDEEMDMYLNMEKEESPYVIDDYNTMNPSPYEPKVVYRHTAPEATIKKTTCVGHEEFDEKKAMLETDQKAEAEAEGEETHVLGSASPEWSGSNKEQSGDVPGESFGEVQTALATISGGSGLKVTQVDKAEVVDPTEWEEEPHSGAGAQSSGTLNQGAGGKKKGAKSKSKKGRKH